MPLTATWLGRESIERIADIRMRCYGGGPAERAAFLFKTQTDRFLDGDVLVLADGTGDVATATSLSLEMNLRGTIVPCQGVAWVGTARSHRRRRVDGHGLASRLMLALEQKARERGQAVSMLAPFRVSFYEAFGYGICEQQHVWTIPLTLIPPGDSSGFAEYQDADFAAALDCRAEQFRQTHGDIATDARGLKHWHATLADRGFRLVERDGDRIDSQFTLHTETEGEQTIAVIDRPFYRDIESLKRMLGMLGSLRDQYSAVRIALPPDLPVNWWLKERQVPHRPVVHAAPGCRMITRMQLKIVDQSVLAAALGKGTPEDAVITVAVRGREAETKLRIVVKDQQVDVSDWSGDCHLTVSDAAWAAIVTGAMPVPVARQMGLFAADPNFRDDQSLAAMIPAGLPYCHEYF